MLKLVAERGQSYEDIAGLLGTDAAEVRERARRALAEAAGADLDRSANVTDYLLGQADPIARADAVRHLSRDDADRDRAERAVLAVEAIAPNATLPDLPPARATREKTPRASRATAPRSSPASPLARFGGPGPLDTPQRRLIALVGGLALAVVVAVIAIAGGGDESADSTTEPVDPDFVRIELAAAAGAKGSGIAVIGQTEDDQPFIELDLEGLGPVGANSTYVLWMLTDDREGIPVAPIEVVDGEFHDRMPLLSPADVVAAFSQSVAVSVMNSDELQASLEGLLSDFSDADAQEAAQGEGQLPVTRYEARTILRGEIPTLADIAKEAEASAEAPAPNDPSAGE